MTDFAWAVIGPGGIANRFAEALQQLPGAYLHSVHGRRAEAAADFAARWTRPDRPAPQVAAELATLLADPRVDAVYVATPHSAHADAVRACLEAGKAVLCEKPMTTALAPAQALVALARERQVFLMEALWTRMLPAYRQVGDWLRSGAIGRLQSLQSSFCFAVPFDPAHRVFNPQLAGGALLDIGIYNLAMSRWAVETSQGAPSQITRIQAQGQLAATGVDQRVHATLAFAGGELAQFVCAVDGAADNSLRLFGELGTIEVPGMFWAAEQAILTRTDQAPESHHAPWRINGFEEQIEEAMRCVRAGLIESPQMPHDETLALMTALDELRRQVGVRYPFEP